MKTVILAAGKGTRFSKNIRSKVLYPINNIPIIINCIETAKSLGSNDFIIVVNEQNKLYIQNIMKSYNITAEYVIQKNINGISSAVSLLSWINDDFILILGDTYTNSRNLSEIIKIHKKYSPVITTTAIVDDDIESVRRACTIKLCQNNKLEQIIEKPDFSTGIRGCGIYVCSSEIFDIIQKHPAMEFTNLMNICDTRCVMLEGICQNINTIEDAEGLK